MSADFTPTQQTIKDLRPFRFWCQKVLPTVYDDSLSYYELLTKVVNYLNDNIDNVNTLNENVENLYNAYVLLQTYVNDFVDIEVPPAVSAKIDEMAEDGTLVALLKEYSEYVTPQMCGAVGDGVTDDTEAILETFTHKNIFIPSGTYLCTGTIKYLSGQTVIGENRETSIIYLLNNGNGFISNCTESGTDAIVNFRMENLTLKFNANSERNAIPIRFNNSYRLYIRHCSFIAVGTQHTYSIVDVHRDFVNYSSGNTWANRFEDCYFYKARVYFNQNTDSWFLNNDINCIGLEYALRLETADGMLCQGNQIIGSLQLGRNVGIEIVDNYFDGYYRHDDPARWDGITQTGALRNAIISRNRFFELPGRAINLSYTVQGLQDVSICDNQFELCDIFNDGLPDIHIARSATATLISGNKGNRYNYYTLVSGVATIGVRPATAPMLEVDDGALNIVCNNVIHSGYTRTLGTYTIAKNNLPSNLFAAHDFGNITATDGLSLYDIIGSVAIFQNANAVIVVGTEYITGTSNRVKLKLEDGMVYIDKVYTSEGVEISDISEFSVFVTTIR